MQIIYPSLVEEAVRFHYPNQKVSTKEKAAIYQTMLQHELILPNGQPSTLALDNGWIKDFYEEENLSFTEFLALYPLFKNYDAQLFEQIDGFWEISLEFREVLLQKLAADTCNYDEKIQIEAYLSDRL
ncbi:hypothetical protein [Enterococcus columbae]|uniref:Uncharacterized protein n=1 Tax=Enterococcus columbae DSM 7374 = ATCC 51263 TaxID=1121865 RepID=S1P3Q4_9ENTE|nr:hypothetical protein [Enterococcus columbae]EOT38625.1 hypothetical protein OMW_02265 [Enterococcus columbae DSM 7374 = ATCC 51263]EOW87724.1 hypothetical protein I568_00010 [Enterococcus columbae DSM 7374 = ATCC 51263]OJG20495.1 hypothetical protein RR47_GL001701 [Enterococcus columbae DSM 7374 = ATCC 51263]